MEQTAFKYAQSGIIMRLNENVARFRIQQKQSNTKIINKCENAGKNCNYQSKYKYV